MHFPGGALKETDTGLWVHLVCALYTPGIAFGELDKLTQVWTVCKFYSKHIIIMCCMYRSLSLKCLTTDGVPSHVHFVPIHG